MISIKTKEEIENMKYAGKVAYEILMNLKEIIKKDITTKDIENYVYDYIISKDCIPSFLEYEGYQFSICASINEEIVHGFPSDRKLKNKDIISVDLGVTYKGSIVDTAYTYIVGNTDKQTQKLVDNTKIALYEGLKVIKDGISLNEVCKNIENVAKKHNYGVFRELTGHGVGRSLHEDPYIPNYSNTESESIILKEGMTLAIEPMFSLGARDVWMLENGWTISTQDDSVSAHFEHTILVTKNGYEIITGE